MIGHGPGGGALARRGLLKLGLGGLTLAALDIGPGWAADRLPPAPALRQPTARFVEAFIDTLVPDTDTPGALRAGVPAYVALVLSRTYVDAGALSGVLDQFDLAEKDLTARGGAPFATLPVTQRARVLAEVDALMMPPGGAAAAAHAKAYRELRGAAIFGYYTSRIGASEELRYQLVPGRFDPDIPFDPAARAFSTG